MKMGGGGERIKDSKILIILAQVSFSAGKFAFCISYVHLELPGIANALPLFLLFRLVGYLGWE